MKIQDILFAAIFIVLIFLPVKNKFVSAGLVLLAMAIPLFAMRIFFTAERLTWYAAAFFLCEAMILLVHQPKGNRL